MPTQDEQLDGLLDAHAEVYAKTTMQYIKGEITENERDKEWHHSDLKTRHALQRMLVEARLGLLEEMKRGEWGVIPSDYGAGVRLSDIEEEAATLRQQLQSKQEHVHDTFCLNYGKCSE